MRLRFTSFVFCVASIVMATAPGALAERCNHWMSPPTSPACCIVIVVEGDQTGNINSCQTSTDGNVNPFANGGGSSTVTETYDSGSNTTTITMCGSPIQPNQSFHYPPGSSNGNGMAHVGLDGGSGPSFTIVSVTWESCSNPAQTPTPTPAPPAPTPTPTPVAKPVPVGDTTVTQTCAIADSTRPLTSPRVLTSGPPHSFASSAPNSMPLLSLSTTQSAGTNPVYYTLYVSGTATDGTQVGAWFQQPYPAGTTPSFEIVNGTNQSVTINSVGFITNDSQRALDTLNFGELPPPGYAGSSFATPSTSLNNTVIAPGGSIPAPTQ